MLFLEIIAQTSKIGLNFIDGKSNGKIQEISYSNLETAVQNLESPRLSGRVDGTNVIFVVHP